MLGFFVCSPKVRLGLGFTYKIYFTQLCNTFIISQNIFVITMVHFTLCAIKLSGHVMVHMIFIFDAIIV